MPSPGPSWPLTVVKGFTGVKLQFLNPKARPAVPLSTWEPGEFTQAEYESRLPLGRGWVMRLVKCLPSGHTQMLRKWCLLPSAGSLPDPRPLVLPPNPSQLQPLLPPPWMCECSQPSF